MRTAFLPGGNIIHADEYDEAKHGFEIFCMDKSCRSPLIYVPKTDKAVSHFKTIGKNSDSKHKPTCGFYQPLDVMESIEKVGEYQKEIIQNSSVKKVLISLNMKKIDPDYEPKPVEKEQEEPKGPDDSVKVKEKSDNPATISSLKSIVKLMVQNEPDLLSTIYFNIGGGRKVPISSMVMNQERAHQILWDEEALRETGYFVYGKVQEIIHRDKVKYIKMERLNGTSFTIVIFEKYFKFFKLTDSQLKDKDILVFGILRKNTFQEKNETEIVIKSDKYIEFLKRRK
ncbi:hypothetical protein [Paenibacillus tepidiphilus]|uniref:hypothetical protein n=1 Tax=Paenibacillus tepidiphilus TaxID=2608683 RepID=UPI00123BE067|nr:hypothetical protein [Paenibacillus tepidiphilus]